MKLAQRIVLGYYRNKFNTLSLVSPRKAAEQAFQLFCTPYTSKRNFKAPPVFENADKLTLTFNGITVKGFGWLPKENHNGKKILICHGFDSYSYRFEKYIIGLIKEGFEVFAFDAPAHGISSGTTITIIQYRDMILKINEQYGPINGFISHSFGGLAIAMALEHMKDNEDKRLVLIAPATETTHAVDTFFKYVKVNNKVRKEFDKLIEEFGGYPASWFSVARVLQNIRTPTLWIHDRDDTITPYEHVHQLTEKGLSHIQFEITQGLGHGLHVDDNIIKRVVTYFTEVYAPTKQL